MPEGRSSPASLVVQVVSVRVDSRDALSSAVVVPSLTFSATAFALACAAASAALAFSDWGSGSELCPVVIMFPEDVRRTEGLGRETGAAGRSGEGCFSSDGDENGLRASALLLNRTLDFSFLTADEPGLAMAASVEFPCAAVVSTS